MNRDGRHSRQSFKPGDKKRVEKQSRRPSPKKEPPVAAGPKHIPNYYFDTEKNRYFRILPGHNCHNPLTWQEVRKNKRKREGRSPPPLRGRTSQTRSVASLLACRELGRISPRNCSRQIVNKQLRSSCPAREIMPYALDRPVKFALDCSGKHLFLCQRSSSGSPSAHFFSLDYRTSVPSLSRNLGKPLYPGPIKAVSWSPVAADGFVIAQGLTPNPAIGLNGRRARIWHCQVDLCAGRTPSLASFSPIFTGPRDTDIRDCVWDPSGAQHSVVFAQEKVTGLVDVLQTKTVSTYKHPTDVLCLSLSQSKPLAMCGLRNGFISMVDFRVKRPVASAVEGPHRLPLALCKVQLFRDDQTAMVASLGNRLAIWDLRMLNRRRCSVRYFKEHRNADSLALDAAMLDEQHLAATGQDSRIRVWDVSSGELLNTLCNPVEGEISDCHVSPSKPPSFAWTPSWQGHKSAPGLLVSWPYPGDENKEEVYWHAGTFAALPVKT